MKNKLGFSQKHPFIFGFSLIIAAVVLISLTMAAFTYFLQDDELNLGGAEAGIVNVSGTITNSENVVAWINKLSRKEEIKGVIVRINSPGGVVAPSQEIYQSLKRISQKKPVIVSMQSVAASGGYYIACAGDTIVANPGSITGSIGVKAELTNIKKLLKKIGVKKQAIVSGELKDAGSPTKELTTEEKEYFQKLVDNLYKQFKTTVVKNRGLSENQVEKLADGRAFTGEQAEEIGLVDVLGGMNEAKEELKKMTGLRGKISFIEGPKREKSLLEWLIGPLNELSVIKEQIAGRWYFKY